ncbi:sensor histidine kinase [Winogradskyella helgolandensis]|uniref:sensor histidine kinase n=1 Tax=Winogradskyella helgolandensis TaxID=2697010 RepID=UPI0015C049D0|nr:histidine kinase [Winogradskyella helgolandensis]
MKHNKLHITLYFLLIWSFSFSQQYTNYSTKDGLPSNHVYTIMQDANGFMWFLTDKGMVRYNGKTFKTFTTKQGLPNNDVWDAFPTPDGKIWYMSKSTHLGYIENDSVFSFPNENEEETINPLYSIQLNNDVYPAGPKKIYTLKDNVWRSSEIHIENKIREDYTIIFNDKVAYLGNRLEDESLNIYDKQNHILSKSSTKDIINQHSSRGQISDSLYFWVSEKSYSILNLKTFALKSFKFIDEVGIETLKYPRINLVGDTIQISGDRFVGTFNTDFHIVNPFFFPPELNAHFGFIDQQNTIWLATFTNGVYKLPYIKQNIVYRFNNEKVQNLNIINNELFASVYNKGFFKYNKTDKTFDPYIASDDYNFGAVYIDRLKQSYFLKQSGIISEGDGKRESISFSVDKQPSVYINSFVKKLTFFKSNLYGIYSFGIFKLDDKTFNVKKDIILKGSNDFLVFNSRLIIATNSGLKELENDSIKKIELEDGIFNKPILSVKSLSNSDILINTDGFGSYISDLKTMKPIENSEFLIVQDAFIQDNDIWLATNSGVLRYSKINNKYKLIRTYNSNDGLPNNNVNTVNVVNEDLIVATNNGLAIVPINQTRKDLFIDVFITDATFNQQSITEDHVVFNYANNNTVNFKFESIDYSEDKLKSEGYLYKLEPLQVNWINTAINSVNYNNLQPGNYVFHVYNKSTLKNINFKIKALWWQTFWFKLIVVLIGIFLIVLISRFIVKKSEFKKNQKIFEDKRLIELQLKALRSQMNPHFVFNSLAAIQFYINENDFEASERYLVKFSKLIRQFFELSKENEISLASEISLLQSYLEIEKLRFKEKLSFKINVDDGLFVKDIKVPTMILQPIIENAINHGLFNKEDNGTVTVNFKKGDEGSLIVEIIDDGVGFVNTAKGQRQGVKSSSVLKDRLHFLNNSKKWNISYSEQELYPDQYEKGNKSIFIMQKL